MSLTEWSETLPDDNGFAGDGDDEIVAAKAGIKERLELDHQFSGELDPLEGDCDGYHKKLTMKALDDDPSPLWNTGVLYTKVVDGVVELFFKDELTGIANQMTEQGVLRLNTLANDLDMAGFGLKNLKLNNKRFHCFSERSNNSSTYIEIKYPCLAVITSSNNSTLGSNSSIFLLPGKYKVQLIITTNIVNNLFFVYHDYKFYVEVDSKYMYLDSQIRMQSVNEGFYFLFLSRITLYNVMFYPGTTTSDVVEEYTP